MNLSNRCLASTIAALAALLTWGCSPEFSPPEKIDKLHLLALKAEPPELKPLAPEGAHPRTDQTSLTSLVADPIHLKDPTHRATVVYLACTPIPGDLAENPCLAFENLEDPTALSGQIADGACSASLAAKPSPGATLPALEPGTGVLGGISFAGIEECNATGCHTLECDATDCHARTTPADPSAPSLAVPLFPPTYVLPQELDFEALPPMAPERINGIVVTIIAMLVDVPASELLPEASVPCPTERFLQNLQQRSADHGRLTSIKRIHVQGPSDTEALNQNPTLAGMSVNGVEFRKQEPTADNPELQKNPALGRTSEVNLLPLPPVDESGKPLTPESLFEHYTRRDAAGQVIETKAESWSFSWFITTGTLKEAHTLEFDEATIWTTPGSDQEPLPENGLVRLYSIVRDLRGGIDWTTRDVKVE